MTWPPTLPFEAVLDRARVFDAEALTLLYRRFLPVVYRYTLAHVGSTHAAEDVTSETFAAVVEHIDQMRARDELSCAAWILGIARNKTLMYLRSAKTHAHLLDIETEQDQLMAVAEGDNPLGIITARESWTEVVEALNRLTDAQRSVVLYRCVLGYSAEEVGELLGKQPGTIRALQFRALASLARYLRLPRSPSTTPHPTAFWGGTR